MTLARALSFALAVAASALPAKAQQPPHHPAGAASAPSSTSKAMREKGKQDMARMDAQMKSMMTMMMDRMPPAPPK